MIIRKNIEKKRFTERVREEEEEEKEGKELFEERKEINCRL